MHFSRKPVDIFCRFEALVGAHRGSHYYEEASRQMGATIQNRCDRVIASNSEKISGILNAGRIAYREVYKATMDKNAYSSDESSETNDEVASNNNKELQGHILPPIKLHALHEAATKHAQEAFEMAVRAAGLPWVEPGDERYDFHQYTCLQWSKQQYEELQVCIFFYTQQYGLLAHMLSFEKTRPTCHTFLTLLNNGQTLQCGAFLFLEGKITV